MTTLRLNAQSGTIDVLLRRSDGLARRCAWLEEQLQDAFDKHREIQLESRRDYLELSERLTRIEARLQEAREQRR